MILTSAALVILTSPPQSATINPAQAVNFVMNGTTFSNGDTIHFTATLAAGMTDRVVTFKEGTNVLGTATSVGGIANFDAAAVNSGSTPIVVSFTVETPKS